MSQNFDLGSSYFFMLCRNEAYDVICTMSIPGMRVGSHGGYCHEIWHRAWQIETGSWWFEMHWLLWQKRGPQAPCNFGAP